MQMFQYYIIDKVLIIKIEGDLLGKGIENQILHLVLTMCPKICESVVVDLLQLNHINSMGLNLLLKILTKFRSEGGEMLLVKPQEKVTRLLATTKLDKIFKMRGSLSQAVSELNNRKRARVPEAIALNI